MNNLTTRKIVFGMLMTLVLAFSVPGIAEALTFTRSSNSGDLQTVLPNEDFTISFSVSPGGDTTAIKNLEGKLVSDDNTTRINSSGYKVVDIGTSEYRVSAAAQDLTATDTFVYRKGSTYETASPSNFVVSSSGTTVYENVAVDNKAYQVYDRTGTGPNYSYATVTAEPDAKVEDANRYHYNQESISITIPSDLTLKRVKTYTVNKGNSDSPHIMNEAKNSVNEDKLTSGSINLTYTADTAGVYTISITDTTLLADRPRDAATALTFTIYVVNFDSAVTTPAFAFTDGTEIDTTTRAVARSDQRDLPIGFNVTGSNPPDDVALEFSVEGGGQVYVHAPSNRATDRNITGRASSTLSTSSESLVYLDLRGNTNKVTVWVSGTNPAVTGKSIIYIHGYAQLEITEGDGQTGAPGGRLEGPLGVKVTDSRNRVIRYPLIVRFPATGTDSYGVFIPFPGTTLLVNNQKTPGTSTSPTAMNTHEVYTDSSSIAKIYYQLNSDLTAGTPYVITPGLKHNTGVTTRFGFNTGTTGSERVANLEILSGNPQSAAKGKDLDEPLVVIARSTAGYRIPNVVIQFRSSIGILSREGLTRAPAEDSNNDLEWGEIPVGTLNPDTGQQIYVRTGSDGQASVTYNVGQFVIARQVTAEIRHEPLDSDYSFAIDRVTFDINGSGSTTPTPPTTPTPGTTPDFTPLRLTVDEASITGQPGSTHDILITASETAQVGNRIFGEFLEAGGSASPDRGTGTFTSTLTLPSTEGVYDLVVSMGTTRRTVTVTVSSTAPGTQTEGQLALDVPLSGAANSTQSIRVTVLDANNNRVPDVDVTLSITSGGGTFSPSRVTTGEAGTATSQLTLGSTAGNNYFVTATASNYPTVEKRISITGTQPPGGDTSEPRAAGEPDAIDVYDGDGQRGVPNVRLADPLVVEVVDSNDTPVSNVRVRFRTTIGSGRFSPVLVRTGQNGRAQTTFMPTSPGRIRISASVNGITARAVFNITAGEAPASLTKVSGDNQSGTAGDALSDPFVVEVQDEDGDVIEGVSVTFSVSAGGGSLSETSATTDEDGRAETTLTLGSQAGINSVQASVAGVDPVTFNTSVDAKILVAAANRPVMYWIAGGGLYSLSGAKEAKIAESANGVAVGGGKIYWTSETSASAGTINSANLDGTGATTLTSILAIPMGIAVDTAGSKLYWTNSRGRIQSASLNGSSIKNVMQNLSDPTDIVVSNGFIYWTEDGNSVRRVNISGQKIATDVAVNLNTVGGLAVGGGKVYWTEQTSASAGTVNGANLNGTNFEALATLLSAPMGISVDTAGSKLYWTNTRGRVQSANLDGSMIKNVVEGLISPIKLAIGGAHTETTTVKAATPAKKDNVKYDVNDDGKVDNVDASLVASGLDTGDAKYDVNDDGTVNFLDLLLIFDNRDEDAAGAPTVVGMKLSAVQIDVIGEQIDLLIATNDRSPAALRTLVYLQQLLTTARPEKTQLFANYPNPFNPETWIPYELATDTHVTITIYNTQGVVIRTLQFGHQSAGYYTDRERAAYWDGRNALGEQVASGLYFYQLETDEMSSMRKMVILK